MAVRGSVKAHKIQRCEIKNIKNVVLQRVFVSDRLITIDTVSSSSGKF